MIINFNTSFREAYMNLTRKQQVDLRNELAKNLNVKGKKTFYKYLNGAIKTISKERYLIIVKSFAKFGIGRDNIFDK